MLRALTIRKSTLGTVLVILTVWIACAPQPTEFNVNDRREKQGENKTIQTVQQDNKNGASELNTALPVSKQLKRSIDLRLNSGVQLEQAKVEDKIYKRYNVAPEADRVCVIPVQVPAGKLYEYDIEWSQTIREGDIVRAPNGDILGTYTILIDFVCQVVAVRPKN